MDRCRTCLRIQDNTQPLFDNYELVTKITTISGVEIRENMDFPLNICRECVDNVNKCYNFRKVIINSDKELKERHAVMSKIKPESPDGTIKLEIHNSDLAENGEEMGESSQNSDEDSVDDILESVDNMLRAKNFKCKDCSEEFSNRWSLSQHRKKRHVKKGVCNVCGLVVRQDNLSRHIQIHSSPPVQCNICEKTFKNFESMRGHMLSHKGLVYTCEICGKQIKTKAEHNRHLQLHKNPDVRKSACKICGKKVRSMKKHLLSHTGERPHICKYCQKGFTSGHALRVHSRQHTNERPYKCEICTMGFAQKVSLVTHLKSKHNIT